MSERQLINILESQVTEAESNIYEVGEQRERNHRYYTLQPLGNERAGRSQYISPDVFDVVESKKAYFRETFFSGRQAAKFSAEGATQDDADAKTEYVNLTLKKNSWYRLARDGWHDAFVAKKMVVFLEWNEDTETEEREVQGFTPQDEQALMQSDPSIMDTVQIEGEIQEIAAGTAVIPVFTGTMGIVRNASYVELMLANPERFFRDPNASYIEDSMYCGYSEDPSRATLIERGYDPEQVAGLSTDYRWKREQEDNSRKAHDSSWTRRRQMKRSSETEIVTVYKTWTWLDSADFMDTTGNTGSNKQNIDPDTLGLYEVHWAGGEVLKWADGSPAIREVDEIPAIEWTEHKISHSETGWCGSDVLAHTQKTNSVLKRLVVDNQQIRNTTRWAATHQGVKNPRELLDNTIGGVVWETIPGTVRALDTPELSPLTFNAIEMLDQDKEERGGMSRLSQGLNTDVVKYQNAADMVERLTNSSNRRIMQAARDFAEDFYIPLCKAIVRIGAKNDDRQYQVESGGKEISFTPRQWDVAELKCETHVALTPDEGLKYAQSLLMMDAQMVAKAQTDPIWKVMYSPQQQHALYDDVFDALGVPDTRRYMLPTDSPQVQEALQGMSIQQQMQQQQQQQMQEFMTFLAQDENKRKWFEAQLEGMKNQTDAMDKAQDNELDQDKFEHQKVVDFEELALEAKGKPDIRRSTSIGG